jgi:hypothetical protein
VTSLTSCSISRLFVGPTAAKAVLGVTCFCRLPTLRSAFTDLHMIGVLLLPPRHLLGRKLSMTSTPVETCARGQQVERHSGALAR